MRILLSNDDGYLAPGLHAMYEVLERRADVVVVAPDRDRSGASNSLTLTHPLRVTQRERGFLAVDGTPTDCVHLAVTGLLPEEPDVVISGINAGPNLGDDVLYSGTVAAAMEGRHLGLPAMAVSCASHEPNHYASAAAAVEILLDEVLRRSMTASTILNINVPDLPLDEIRGFRATRLGNRHRAEPVIRARDPRGSEIFWVGPAGPEQDAGPGTDFDAIRHGYVSITPLHVDLTRHQAHASLSGWVDSLTLG